MSTEFKVPPIVQHIFIIIGFFILSNTFRHMLGGIWNPLRMVFYAGVLFFVAVNFRIVMETLIRSPLIMALTAIAPLSVFWADFPGATVSRSFALIIMTLFIALVCARYNIRQQIQLLALVLFMFMVLSVILVFALPEYGLQFHMWRGIFTHKNLFGRFAALAALIALVYPVSTVRGSLLKWGSYFTCLWLVTMSDSGTALVIIVIITLTSLVYRIFRIGVVQGVAMLAVTAVPSVFLVIMAQNIDTNTVLDSMGKDATLTGRTAVWENLEYAISLRPYLGYGFGSFWSKWDGIYGELWSRYAAWVPGSGHNAYLDLAVDLGVITVGMFIICLIFTALQALNYIRQASSSVGLWPILCVTFLFILSFSESFVMYNDITWCLFLIVAFSLNNRVMHDRQPEVAPEARITQLAARVRPNSLPMNPALNPVLSKE